MFLFQVSNPYNYIIGYAKINNSNNNNITWKILKCMILKKNYTIKTFKYEMSNSMYFENAFKEFKQV